MSKMVEIRVYAFDAMCHSNWWMFNCHPYDFTATISNTFTHKDNWDFLDEIGMTLGTGKKMYETVMGNLKALWNEDATTFGEICDKGSTFQEGFKLAEIKQRTNKFVLTVKWAD